MNYCQLVPQSYVRQILTYLVTLQILTTCFDQYGHHQVLKFLGEETAVLLP
jgi:hypothetical protein